MEWVIHIEYMKVKLNLDEGQDFPWKSGHLKPRLLRRQCLLMVVVYMSRLQTADSKANILRPEDNMVTAPVLGFWLKLGIIT